MYPGRRGGAVCGGRVRDDGVPPRGGRALRARGLARQRRHHAVHLRGAARGAVLPGLRHHVPLTHQPCVTAVNYFAAAAARSPFL